MRVAAIGSSTKAHLLRRGILADLVPKKESSEGLIEEFRRLDLRGGKIFLPRSDISDKNLAKAFEKLGAKVVTGFAYRNVAAKNLPNLDLESFNEVMFTSPSGVRNFLKNYGHVPKGVRVSCIGDVTLKEARRCGFAG